MPLKPDMPVSPLQKKSFLGLGCGFWGCCLLVLAIALLDSITGFSRPFVKRMNSQLQQIGPWNPTIPVPEFHSAVGAGDIEKVKRMIEAGEDINEVSYQGRTPLEHAVMGNRLSLCRMLLEKGADPNYQDGGNDSLLHEATRQKNLEIMTLLLDYGANSPPPISAGTSFSRRISPRTPTMPSRIQRNFSLTRSSESPSFMFRTKCALPHI